MKLSIKNDEFTLTGILKCMKKYKLAKKWTFVFNLNVNKDRDQNYVDLNRTSINLLALAIQECLRQIKRQFPKNARLFANIELSFENLR